MLILAMWVVVRWAFGWRVLCVALVWWGTNYAATYNYIGGAFLRHDWLFLAITGICLVKRGHNAAGGFALAWSALLRIFPAVILLGLFLKVVADSWRARRVTLAPAQLRFGAGAILALLVWVPLTFTVGDPASGPFSAWTQFVNNSRKLTSSPMTNSVGLPVVVAFTPANRSVRIKEYWLDSPWDIWKEGRRRSFAERRIVYLGVLASFVLLLAVAVRGRDDWLALTLGIGAVPFFGEISSYYYGILLGLAFVWPLYPIAGIGLATTATLSNLLLGVWRADDDRYTVISLLIVLLVTLVTIAAARANRHQVEGR
jgi:hypothetical protein